VNHISAEQREQFWQTAFRQRRVPSRISEIEPQRQADIRQVRMRAPRRDAFQMRLGEIARPPDDTGTMVREMHHMLAGAAAGFQHVAGLAGEEGLQHRPDRRVIAMKAAASSRPSASARPPLPNSTT
jgi:hypothetical protein